MTDHNLFFDVVDREKEKTVVLIESWIRRVFEKLSYFIIITGTLSIVSFALANEVESL